MPIKNKSLIDVDVLYVHNCPDRELGYYSGTPNGNVDILRR